MIQWIVFPWENPSEEVRVSSGHLCEAEAPTEAAAEKRVSSGDLCEAEAPTEAAAETLNPWLPLAVPKVHYGLERL